MTRRAEGLDQFDRKVIDDIETHGWSDIGVFPTEEKPGVCFNYTVGLTEQDHPELIMIGLANPHAHGVLSAAYRALERGVEFSPGCYYSEVLAELRVAFVEVLDLLDERCPLSMVSHLYGEVPALQLVWPDTHDRFPWHGDYESKYQDQLLLGPWLGNE